MVSGLVIDLKFVQMFLIAVSPFHVHEELSAISFVKPLGRWKASAAPSVSRVVSGDRCPGTTVPPFWRYFRLLVSGGHLLIAPMILMWLRFW